MGELYLGTWLAFDDLLNRAVPGRVKNKTGFETDTT